MDSMSSSMLPTTGKCYTINPRNQNVKNSSGFTLAKRKEKKKRLRNENQTKPTMLVPYCL